MTPFFGALRMIRRRQAASTIEEARNSRITVSKKRTKMIGKTKKVAVAAAKYAPDQRRSMALPAPPSLHWAIVLALSAVTFGIFTWIWAFVQAIWVKRLTGTWKPLLWLSAPLILLIVMSVRGTAASTSSFGWLFLFALFSMKFHILRHYNDVEPIGLKLGTWRTFFGSVFYLQYHLTRIARLKREQPQLFWV